MLSLSSKILISVSPVKTVWLAAVLSASQELLLTDSWTEAGDSQMEVRVSVDETDQKLVPSKTRNKTDKLP